METVPAPRVASNNAPFGEDACHSIWTGGLGGAKPPYHGPVFELARRPRPDLVLEGGTIFSFVTDGH